MKALLKNICLVFLCLGFSSALSAQTNLIDTKFDQATLPNFVTSDGTPNPGKAADGIEQTPAEGNVNSSINVSALAPGVYLMVFGSGTDTSSVKIIKQQPIISAILD